MGADRIVCVVCRTHPAVPGRQTCRWHTGWATRPVEHQPGRTPKHRKPGPAQ